MNIRERLKARIDNMSDEEIQMFLCRLRLSEISEKIAQIEKQVKEYNKIREDKR